jgi:glucose/arabinose dehydrogenase
MQRAGTISSMRTLSVGLLGLVIVTAAAHAQQAAGPQPWQQGMAAGLSESKLAPIAPPPLPTPADKLPLDKLKVKDGFKIEVYAAGVPNARTLRLGDKGTVFVSSRVQDKVHALVTKDGKREMKVIASGLHRPNGIALHNGTLYIAELSQISKIDKIEDNLDNPPKPTVILDGLPKDEPHGWKYLTVGPDEKLYFQVGAPCNICIPSDRHTKIYRVGLDGKGLEVYASGIRQIVGMDWHPTLKQLYFSENSRDWLSEDVPEDKLNRVTQPGKDNFGFPYCHQGTFTDPEFGWGHSCKEFTPPVALLGPHSAALGIKFYTGNGLGDDYRGVLFLARHGSWNRTVKIGGDIVAIKLNDDGTFQSMEPFVTGFIQNNNYVGRPVDVLPMPDGSLLVSDDFNGAVYRVSRAQ